MRLDEQGETSSARLTVPGREEPCVPMQSEPAIFRPGPASWAATVRPALGAARCGLLTAGILEG